MQGLRRGTTILVTIAAMLAVGAAGVATADAAPRQFYGVVPQTSLGAKDYALMHKGGVGVVRMPLIWPAADPGPGGDFTWESFDEVVGAAARQRITVLPFISGTPTWVATDLDHQHCGSSCALYAPSSGAALTAWRDFIAAAVDRYGPDGHFWTEHPGPAEEVDRAWQIWNEQNSSSFFRPKPSPQAYAKLLDSAARAIRPRDPGADIVLGGMAGLSGSSKAITGWKYLHKLYRVGGTKSDFDGVGIHPYGASLDAVSDQVDRFHGEIKRAHDTNAGLWVTEIGWGSNSGGNPLSQGKKGQAKRLTEAYRYFAHNRHRLNVKTVDWFSWKDSNSSICDWCAKSGLRTGSLKAKPAWRAFKHEAR